MAIHNKCSRLAASRTRANLDTPSLPHSISMPKPKSPAVPHPTLRVQGIEFRRGRSILRGIDWTVEQGQHWCMLGPNGCGKTSLINIITGYDSATEGTIEIDGSRYGEDDWREVRKRVGIVASTLTTFLESSEPVVDVVASGRDAKLNLWEVPPQTLRRQARILLKRAGVAYLSKGLWGPLSQGEKQKVLICRAMMAKFRVLILDEPCAGLDPVAREHFLQWLQGLCQKRGAPALIMVTHHVEEILPSMTHVIMLKDGQVMAAGTKQEVLTSERLSEAYGARVSLHSHGDRYQLSILS